MLKKLISIIFKIIIFLKNPNKGGIPPNDIKNIIEFIWLNIFYP